MIEPKKVVNAYGQTMYEISQVAGTDGKPVYFTEREYKLANSLERQANSLGYEVAITTLTAISKRISEQKFYQIPFAECVPVVVGEGAWSSNITTYRSFDAASEFEQGMINVGGQNSRLASADAAVDALNILVYNWAKENTWSIPELELASRSGNWDIVAAKEKARKRNWDLGLQRIAFLGARGQNGASGNCLGVLNQSGVTVDTATITTAISSMTTSQLKSLTVNLIQSYQSNAQYTVFPDRFLVPQSDYNGMASTVSPDFPIKSILELLTDMFKTICGPGFRIMPVAYADKANHADISSLSGKQIYTLLRYDEESVKMNIPVDYTNTLANSLNSFQFQNVGYGQFSGVQLLRPLEMLYLTY